MKMKKNDIKEVVALGTSAISGKISELTNSLAKANLDLKRGKLKNVREKKNLRRAIAVLKTIRTQGEK